MGIAVDVLTAVEIDRPRDVVAAFAGDPESAMAWYRDIKPVEWETPSLRVVGSKMRFLPPFLGRTVDYTYEVREIELGRRFVTAISQGPFPMETGGGRGAGCNDDDRPPPRSVLGFASRRR